MLTSRSSGRQTRLPEESSRSRCRKGRVACGGGGRHTVRLTPVDTRSARAHARKQQQQEVEEVKELQRSMIKERVQSARTYRDTCATGKPDTHPPGHMTRCLCVQALASSHKEAHGTTVNYVCLLQGGQADKRVSRQSRQAVGLKIETPVGEEGDTR